MLRLPSPRVILPEGALDPPAVQRNFDAIADDGATYKTTLPTTGLASIEYPDFRALGNGVRIWGTGELYSASGYGGVDHNILLQHQLADGTYHNSYFNGVHRLYVQAAVPFYAEDGGYSTGASGGNGAILCQTGYGHGGPFTFEAVVKTRATSGFGALPSQSSYNSTNYSNGYPVGGRVVNGANLGAANAIRGFRIVMGTTTNVLMYNGTIVVEPF